MTNGRNLYSWTSQAHCFLVNLYDINLIKNYNVEKLSINLTSERDIIFLLWPLQPTSLISELAKSKRLAPHMLPILCGWKKQFFILRLFAPWSSGRNGEFRCHRSSRRSENPATRQDREALVSQSWKVPSRARWLHTGTEHYFEFYVEEHFSTYILFTMYSGNDTYFVTYVECFHCSYRKLSDRDDT